MNWSMRKLPARMTKSLSEMTPTEAFGGMKSESLVVHDQSIRANESVLLPQNGFTCNDMIGVATSFVLNDNPMQRPAVTKQKNIFVKDLILLFFTAREKKCFTTESVELGRLMHRLCIIECIEIAVERRNELPDPILQAMLVFDAAILTQEELDHEGLMRILQRYTGLNSVEFTNLYFAHGPFLLATFSGRYTEHMLERIKQLIGGEGDDWMNENMSTLLKFVHVYLKLRIVNDVVSVEDALFHK